MDFGAFVDLGGIEGLLHISEMSWGRIGHPSELFVEGQEIEVKVLSVEIKKKINFGTIKTVIADPWKNF